MKVYIVRHGETDWNKEGRRQGSIDIPLNEKGIEQANILKDKLKDIKFDLCISSPLKRAYKTAEIIYGNDNIITNDLLKERYLGEYEGTTIGNSKFDFYYYMNYKINASDHGVEPFQDLLKRCHIFLEDLKRNYRDYENILIVTHGFCGKCLYYNLVGYNEDTDFSGFKLENCEYFAYVIK